MGRWRQAPAVTVGRQGTLGTSGVEGPHQCWHWEPLAAGSTLCQPRPWREWGHTDTDGQMEGMLCLPSQGHGTHGTPARTTLESRHRWAAVPLDSAHSLGTAGSPLPCTRSPTAPSKSTSHGCRRERWGRTAHPGTVQCPASTHHPDAFQVPWDSPRPLSPVPWDPLQLLEGAGCTVGPWGTCQGCGQRGHPNPWRTLAAGDAPKSFNNPTPGTRSLPRGQGGLSPGANSSGMPVGGRRKEGQQPPGMAVRRNGSCVLCPEPANEAIFEMLRIPPVIRLVRCRR